jgi:hypothetical protein
MKPKAVVIKLNAGNDLNGNPRRVFVVLAITGEILGTADEGYIGLHAVCEKWPDLGFGYVPEFETTPKEYRYLTRKKA